MTYEIRHWNASDQKIDVSKFSLQEIIISADFWQMNMIDVGLVLLNLERGKRNLPLISFEQIANEEIK